MLWALIVKQKPVEGHNGDTALSLSMFLNAKPQTGTVIKYLLWEKMENKEHHNYLFVKESAYCYVEMSRFQATTDFEHYKVEK